MKSIIHISKLLPFSAYFLSNMILQCMTIYFSLRKSQSGYAVSLDQAKHCSKHQKSWVQPKSWEIVLPNQLSRIHYYGIYLTVSNSPELNMYSFYRFLYPIICITISGTVGDLPQKFAHITRSSSVSILFLQERFLFRPNVFRSTQMHAKKKKKWEREKEREFHIIIWFVF